MVQRFLFNRIDNAPLIVFRIFFGILCACECYGAILTGWVRRTLVEPNFTFNFIGFEWLQPLPGTWMYAYFFLMGTLGLCMALGYRYRLSALAFTLLWAAVYLMQKTSYNNHYYLLILISGFMVLYPANRYFAMDLKRKPQLRKINMPTWVKWSVVLQLFIVYTYASVAKMYGDWLDFGIVKILMQGKVDYPIIGTLLQQPWLHKIIGICGILFDLLIVPALLWRPTRRWAFIASIFFHLFNSIVFQIGIFPYLSLAFTLFFLEPRTIRNLFLKKKPIYEDKETRVPKNAPWILVGFALYFAIQLVLPLRHHFIKDDVLWTEEGHRLSWRMMLRSRTGSVRFKIVDRNNGEIHWVKPAEYLTKKQQRRIAAYPDFVWQFAQHLKKEWANRGIPISVYATNSRVSVNGKPYRAFIDPEVDLANTPWDHFRHNDFILPSPGSESAQN